MAGFSVQMSCLESRPFHVGCVVNKVATGTGISLYTSVSPLSNIPKMLHIPSSTCHWCYIILLTGIVLKWKPLRATCLVPIENIQQSVFNFLKLWRSECRVWDASDILVQKHFSEPKVFLRILTSHIQVTNTLPSVVTGRRWGTIPNEYWNRPLPRRATGAIPVTLRQNSWARRNQEPSGFCTWS